MLSLVPLLLSCTAFVSATYVDPVVLDACSGYKAQNVTTTSSSLTAELALAGTGCAVFGPDIQTLQLQVTYETDTRIHVKITDKNKKRYEVPESVFPRPTANTVSSKAAQIQFNYTANPFSFTVYRTNTKEILFSTASHPLIFEDQYLRVKTSLPNNANIYGLGEHTNPFRLPTSNTTLTLWSRDAYGVPAGSNLYGNHPVYFEHRTTGTHGVFLLSSNGMDIKLNDTNGSTSLEYNVIGGVLDFYFFAGSETDPTELARQYAEIVGTPAEVPYWSFGLHQCRFGYQSGQSLSRIRVYTQDPQTTSMSPVVITNYSVAGIPLQTMWTDIDYMDRRRIFTVDPQYFPLNRMREIVSYLHGHDQHFVLMTDPALLYQEGYGPYDRGKALDVFLKLPDGSLSIGLVWPGVTVFPDWFHPATQQYWTNEFKMFYSPTDGLDIDGAWIDMNEPSNFCNLPCTNPFEQAKQQDLPPARTSSPPDPNAPIFVNSTSVQKRDLLNPPYAINNAAPGGNLSSKTAWTNSTHANGLVEYDTHNLYGTMMSENTHNAMLSRRPGLRTLVITRSTFAGAGRSVGKWLGDNFSQWSDYRISIAGILGFAGVYQVPMVGADICGYAGNTTETLCARWAMLGAFYPFMRNHNSDTSNSQEFYRWEIVAQAARNALDMRYRLIDYIYTTFHVAHTTGTPVIQPMWYHYPKDANTFPIDLQFFFGSSILVSPVTEENSTSVSAYFPNDIFYDFLTLAPLQGAGKTVEFGNISFTQIPVHIRGGVVLPLRVESAMTTNELRGKDFELVVAPSTSGKATGQLYMDDGVSVSPSSSTNVKFTYTGQTLVVTGSFGFKTGAGVKRVRFLNVMKKPSSAMLNDKPARFTYDATNRVLDVSVGLGLKSGFTVTYR